METLTYLSNFFKDRYVASLVPTFSWAVDSACSGIDFKRDLNIIEYGAGTGVFTRYLLKHMTARSKLIAIERNEGMFNDLVKRVNDPRLYLHNDSADRAQQLLNEHRIAHADYIISGIPFSLFSPELTKSVVETTASALSPDGEFIVYQCLWTGKESLIFEELQRNFAELNTKSIPINIPPLVVYSAKTPQKLSATLS